MNRNERLGYRFGVVNKELMLKEDGELCLEFDKIYDEDEEIISNRYILREDYDHLIKHNLEQLFSKKYILRQFFIQNKFEVKEIEDLENVFTFISSIDYWRYIFLYQTLPFEYYLRNRRKANI